MRRSLFATLLVLCLPLLLILACGCTSNTPPPIKKYVLPKPEKRKPLPTTAWDGVVRGKVVYDGEPPVMPLIDKINYHGDKEGCLKGAPSESRQQTWFVHPDNRGIRYVAVWLDPPAGTYFTLRDEDKKRDNEQVRIEQPHCAFIPHVASLFPAYFDGEKEVPTGQKLVVKNTAPFLHTFDWPQSLTNDGKNLNIPPGQQLEFVLNPQKDCLAFGCGIHNWMYGILWIFDHPYHAVTREDGSFEIANVPADVELTFNAWHESGIRPFEKRTVTFKKGENPPIELKIKK